MCGRASVYTHAAECMMLTQKFLACCCAARRQASLPRTRNLDNSELLFHGSIACKRALPERHEGHVSSGHLCHGLLQRPGQRASSRIFLFLARGGRSRSPSCSCREGLLRKGGSLGRQVLPDSFLCGSLRSPLPSGRVLAGQEQISLNFSGSASDGSLASLARLRRTQKLRNLFFRKLLRCSELSFEGSFFFSIQGEAYASPMTPLLLEHTETL